MSRSVQLCPTCGGENCDGHKGVPPGSGGVVLWRCLEKCAQCSRHWVETHGDVRGCYVGGVCGVRFPADDPDPGRYYRAPAKAGKGEGE